jgi:hypothetical protein
MSANMISEERAAKLVKKATNDAIASWRNGEITKEKLVSELSDINDCEKALEAQRERMTTKKL